VYIRESVEVKIIRLSHIVHTDDDDDDYVFSFSLYEYACAYTYIYILNDRSNRARIKNDRICRVKLIANKIYVENNHFTTINIQSKSIKVNCCHLKYNNNMFL